MKPALYIAGVTGIAASFAVPLPLQPAGGTSAPKGAWAATLQGLPRTTLTESRAWPLDVAFINKMSASDCSEALNGLIRHHAWSPPDGATLDAAVALTMRLSELSAAAKRNPLQGRLLPVWLMQEVTGSYLKHTPVPPANWMAAVAASNAGREAMANLISTLAPGSPDKAKALMQACPDRWKRGLSGKLREGLAERDPLAAAREAWETAAPVEVSIAGELRSELEHYRFLHRDEAPRGDDRLTVLQASARKGPVKETVAALSLYGEGAAGDADQQNILAMLLRRDPAATRAAVEKNGDPVLNTHLRAAEQLLAAKHDAVIDLRTEEERQRDTAASHVLSLNPDEAARKAIVEEGAIPIGLVKEGITSPREAFEALRTKKNGSLEEVFRRWVQIDGPAAVQAALTLPPDHWLRTTVEGVMAHPDVYDDAWQWRTDLRSKRDAFLESPPASHFDPQNLMGDEIRAAAKYAKAPLPASPAAPAPGSTPAGSSSGSSLWNAGHR